MSQTEFMAADLDLSRQQILDVPRINLAAANKLVQALDKPLGAAKPTPQAIAEAARPVLDERGCGAPAGAHAGSVEMAS